jgi:hydrogenase maturation protease
VKILVAGIGNLFKADDAFGCEVAQRLSKESLGDFVKVVDFGIRGFDLAYTFVDGGYDLVILIDAVQRGGKPGTLYLIEPDLNALQEESPESAAADSHGMHPAKVLAWAKALGAEFPALRLVGCEPEDVVPEDEDIRVGLTPAVQASVDGAVRMIQSIVAHFPEETLSCTK